MAVLFRAKKEHGPDPPPSRTTPRVGATLSWALDENAATPGRELAKHGADNTTTLPASRCAD
jgi:hypothetical protein